MSWSTNSYAPSSQRAPDEPEWNQPTFDFLLDAAWANLAKPRILAAHESALIDPSRPIERHSASSLILPPVEPVGQRHTQWNDLTVGVQWAILKILCENEVPTNPKTTPRAFSLVVSTVLRLKRRQIQAFLSVYVDEFEKWQKFERTAAAINWPEIIRLATDRGMPLHQLLPKNRPRLSTDSIAPEAVADGVAFLRAAGLDAFAERLGDWIGTNLYGDFIGLKVEAEILRDFLDGQALRKAEILGWVDLAQIRRNLVKQRKENGLPLAEQRTGIFSYDFEGDPHPARYFTKEYKALGVESSRKKANVPAGEERSQPKRTPTNKEAAETREAFARMILQPECSWSQIPQALQARGLSRQAGPTLATAGGLPAQSQQQQQVAGSSARQTPQPPSTNASVTQEPASARRLPSATSQRAFERERSASADDRAARFTQAAEQTVLTTTAAAQSASNSNNSNNKKKNQRGFGHTKSSFAPIVVRDSGTPDSLPPHQQLRATAIATAIANSFSQASPGGESPQDCEAAQSQLKRNRKPSRRLRDTLESESDYRPESDENPQPKKKQKKNAAAPKNAATSAAGAPAGRRQSQLDGTNSATPSPQLLVQELESSVEPSGDANGTQANKPPRPRPRPKPANLNLAKMPQARADAKSAFGMHLHSPITVAGIGRLTSTNYAWSSQTSYFAWVATDARYALHVTDTTSGNRSNSRTRSPPNLDEMRKELGECEVIFRRLEGESIGVGGQDADEAMYAGLSDFATFAVYADTAMYVL